MMLCGVYDTRPWEGKPSELAASDFYRQVQPIEGERLCMRLEHVDPAGPFDVPRARAMEESSAELCAGLSVLIAGFDAQVGSYVRRQNQPRTPRLPDADPWGVNSLAQLGPNVIPEILTAGVAEVDLTSWSRRSRFVAVWLWGYWTGIAGVLDSGWAIQWTISARPHHERWASPVITWPVLSLPDGPYVAPTDPHALWRFGSFPDNGGADVRRVSVVNGGAAAATVNFRHYAGPCATNTAYVGANDIMAIPAGATAVRALVDRSGYSHTGVWGSHTAAVGNVGGPLLISVVGGS